MVAADKSDADEKPPGLTEDKKTKDVVARIVAVATLALTCFNTYTTFTNRERDDERHVRTLLNSAWDELAGAEAAPAITSNIVLTANQRREVEKVGRKVDEALSYDPQNPLALTLKGIYFAKLRMPNEARGMLQKALVADPSFARAKSALGRLLADEGKHNEAIIEFQAATSMDPKLPSPYLGWASCLKQLNRLDEAAAVLQKGIASEPAFGPLHLELGNVYAVQGREEEALERYKTCREVDDSQTMCYRNAVVVLLRLNREMEARKLVNEAQAKGIVVGIEKKPKQTPPERKGS